jgi:hypothetical protein
MSNVLYLKLAREPNNGLCNQLLSLVSGILFCIKTKKELLIVDKFLTEINTNSYCSITQVFNLIEMNKYLNRYNIKIVDGFNIDSSAFRPISWEVITLAKKQTNYRLMAFINEIYNNIFFSKYLTEYSTNFINENFSDVSKKINVIHIRLEDDAIYHWSKQNNMRNDTFKQLLIVKYIELIKTNIKKDDITLILSGNINNEVVHYMKINEYNIKFINKKFSNGQYGRELNAVIDLIIGKCCNNIFIGCDGSTFSELLTTYIADFNKSNELNESNESNESNKTNNITKIMFNLNNILL